MAPSDPTGCRRWRGDRSTRSLHSPRGTPCRWCRGLRVVCSETKQVPKQMALVAWYGRCLFSKQKAGLGERTPGLYGLCFSVTHPGVGRKSPAGLRLGHAQPLAGDTSSESSGCAMGAQRGWSNAVLPQPGLVIA